MRFPRRCTFWLSAALLLAVAVGAWLLVPPSRITQANFDRISAGMDEEEVTAILGEPEPKRSISGTLADHTLLMGVSWHRGPNWIVIEFFESKVASKMIHLASLRETLTRYAKKGAAKIGVKWD